MRSTTLIVSLAYLAAIAYCSPISLAEDIKSPHNGLEKRNILVPGYLIPTSTVNPDEVAGTPITASLERVPTSTVDLATDSKAKRDVTSMPDLVPTSEVNLATDTAGTRTISPKLMPTSVASIGATTSGCVVSISNYSFVTHCDHTTTPTPTSTGIADCCGGWDALYPCNDAGTTPTGAAEWTCTLGSTSCAGVTTATTMWV